MPEGAVYVGRPTRYGNLWSGPKAAANFENWANRNIRPEMLSELRGKNLVCWCRLDQPCHADVLLELANA